MSRKRLAMHLAGVPRGGDVRGGGPDPIPGAPEPREACRRLGVEPGRVAREERLQLEVVRVLGLRVDLPDERARRPLRPP